MLPNLQISEKLKLELDEIYLEFLTNLYWSTARVNKLTTTNETWFLSEIGYYLPAIYPNRSHDEYIKILQQIVDIAIKNKDDNIQK